MQSLYVRDLMSSPVITITPATRLPAIKLLMRQKRVHRLPVVEHGRLAGIVTLGDVRNAFPSDVLPTPSHASSLLERITARDLMRSELVTVMAHAPLAEAAHLLLHHKISGLPVVENHQLMGIITKSDLCRAIIGDDSVLALPTLPDLEQATAV